jgi:hypothetical protein
MKRLSSAFSFRRFPPRDNASAYLHDGGLDQSIEK